MLWRRIVWFVVVVWGQSVEATAKIERPIRDYDRLQQWTNNETSVNTCYYRTD
jgi:hypothetical protein